MEEYNNSLSSTLVGAMKSKRLTVEKLSESTGISERFINLLIEEKYEELPASPYLYGYVVRLSEKLELDGARVWDVYFKNNETLKSSGKKDRLPENRFNSLKINGAIISAVAIILIATAYFLFRFMFSAPDIALSNLSQDPVITNKPSFTVEGNVDPGLKFTVNGERVYLKSDGSFQKSIQLDPGFNSVVFIAKDVLAKKEVVKQIFYDASKITGSNATSTREDVNGTTGNTPDSSDNINNIENPISSP